jgi:hypothetical protein
VPCTFLSCAHFMPVLSCRPCTPFLFSCLHLFSCVVLWCIHGFTGRPMQCPTRDLAGFLHWLCVLIFWTCPTPPVLSSPLRHSLVPAHTPSAFGMR